MVSQCLAPFKNGPAKNQTTCVDEGTRERYRPIISKSLRHKSLISLMVVVPRFFNRTVHHLVVKVYRHAGC